MIGFFYFKKSPAMFFIYILYSESSDLYYTGYSENPEKRLEDHNFNDHPTFTSKHRPLVMIALFEASESRSEVMKMEKFIKKQRNRNFIETLIKEDFIPNSSLAQLVRVPKLR